MAQASNIFILNQDVPDISRFYKHAIAVQVLSESTEYSALSSSCAETSSKAVEGCIIFRATLDAYVDTIITCLRANGSKNVVGYRQNFYVDIFPSFRYVASTQQEHQIWAFVEQWCPKEVVVLFLSLHINEDL